MTLDKIEGAVVWENKRTYFFSGNQYWRFNENSKKVDVGYPKSGAYGWKGIRYPVDDVLVWKKGKTFFFSEEKVYRFRDGVGMKIKKNPMKQKISYFIKTCRYA